MRNRLAVFGRYLKTALQTMDQHRESKWLALVMGLALGYGVALHSPSLLLVTLLGWKAFYWLLDYLQRNRKLGAGAVFVSCSDPVIESHAAAFLRGDYLDGKWYLTAVAPWLVHHTHSLPPVETIEQVLAVAATLRKQVSRLDQLTYHRE